MQTSGFVDKLLHIHRDGNAFRNAARACAGFGSFCNLAASESREWISVRQATIASLKTRLAMAFSNLMGDSDAPVAAEVERILSNLMAHIAPYRSRTCWRKHGRQSRENSPPSSALDLHPWTPPPGQAPFPAGYGPPTQLMLMS
jgi:hypothetical protein